MTETFQHTFKSGRVCTVRVRCRRGQIPVLKCLNPRGEFTDEEMPEYIQWRKFIAARTLQRLDPVAIAKLALSPDEEDGIIIH